MVATLVTLKQAFNQLTEDLCYRRQAGDDSIDPEDLWFMLADVGSKSGRVIEELPAQIAVLLQAAANRRHLSEEAERLFRLDQIMNELATVHL